MTDWNETLHNLHSELVARQLELNDFEAKNTDVISTYAALQDRITDVEDEIKSIVLDYREELDGKYETFKVCRRTIINGEKLYDIFMREKVPDLTEQVMTIRTVYEVDKAKVKKADIPIEWVEACTEEVSAYVRNMKPRKKSK